MKRFISIVLVAIICLSFASGCAKNDSEFFGYDVKQYVEVGEIFGLEYEEQTLSVTDADIKAYMEYELGENGYGEQKEVTDRPVQNGDTVNIDFVGTKDGVAFEGGTSKGYDLVIGSNSFIDGFESGLVGAKKGQTLDLNLKFPENYGKEGLNGAAVVFTVTINSIKSAVQYPEITDKLVQEISKECKTVAEYKEYVKKTLEEYNAQNIKADNESQVWSKIIENSKLLKFPEAEREFAKEMALKVLDQKYYYQAGVTFQDAVTQSGLTMESEEVKQIIDTECENLIKEFLVVVAIARDQDLDITPEEYAQKLEQTAKEKGYSSVDEYKKTIDEKQFYLSLLNLDVTKLIMENAVKTNK